MPITITRDIKGLEQLEYAPTLEDADLRRNFDNLFSNQVFFRYFCAYPFHSVVQNPTNKMKNAERIMNTFIQLDADDGIRNEDEFEDHLIHYLKTLEKTPIMKILPALEQQGFLKKGGKGKNRFFSNSLRREMQKDRISFVKLASQNIRHNLLGYRYEKGTGKATSTGESSRARQSEPEKAKLYSSRSSDFMDAFDKGYAIIVENLLKDYISIDVNDTSTYKGRTIRIDTREYFRKLFIKNGFGDFNDPEEFYFGVRDTSEDDTGETKDSSKEHEDAVAAELRSGKKQKMEEEARKWFYSQEDVDEDDERNAVARKRRNIKPDNVTYTMLANHLDPNWFKEDVEKMLRKAANIPKDSKNKSAIEDALVIIGKTQNNRFYIQDYNSKKKMFSSVEDFYDGLNDFLEENFSQKYLSRMVENQLDDNKKTRLKEEVKGALKPQNNLIEVGMVEIELRAYTKHLESLEDFSRFLMSDKNWGEQPFEPSKNPKKKTDFEKDRDKLIRHATRVFDAFEDIKNAKITIEELTEGLEEEDFFDKMLGSLFGSGIGKFDIVVNTGEFTKLPDERRPRMQIRDTLGKIDVLRSKLQDDLNKVQEGGYSAAPKYVTDPNGEPIWFEYDENTKQYGKSLGVKAMHRGEMDYGGNVRRKLAPTKEGDEFEAVRSVSRYLNIKGDLPTNPAEVEKYRKNLRRISTLIIGGLNKLEDALSKDTKPKEIEIQEKGKKKPTKKKVKEIKPLDKGSVNYHLMYEETNEGREGVAEWIEDWLMTTEKGGWRHIATEAETELGEKGKSLDIPFIWIASTGIKEKMKIDTRAIRSEPWRSSAKGGSNPYREGTRFGDERIPTGKTKLVKIPGKEDKKVKDEYGRLQAYGNRDRDEARQDAMDLIAVYEEYVDLKQIVEGVV